MNRDPSKTAEAPMRSPGRAQSTALAVAVTVLLVFGAWYVGGRQGFAEIGAGGQNTQLLPRVGDPAPDFATSRLNGTVARLSDYRGQPVWLNFWGSWCPPCRSEFPEMLTAYVEYLEPNGVEILAVSLDEPAEMAAVFAWRNKGTFTVLSDPDRSDTGAAYPIANFPTHILIDADGIIRDVILAPLDEAGFREAAAAIIAPEGSS